MQLSVEAVGVADHPMLNNGYPPVIQRALDDAQEEIADEGVSMVRQRLARVLRNPTGFYESQIGTERSGDTWWVDDNGTIYGPWLEGVSERNRTTRFPGYHTFRIVKQELDARAGLIAQDVVDEALRRVE